MQKIYFPFLFGLSIFLLLGFFMCDKYVSKQTFVHGVQAITVIENTYCITCSWYFLNKTKNFQLDMSEQVEYSSIQDINNNNVCFYLCYSCLF